MIFESIEIYSGCFLRATGGIQAEKEERQKWENADRKRIMDSVYGLIKMRDEYRARNQAVENNGILPYIILLKNRSAQDLSYSWSHSRRN